MNNIRCCRCSGARGVPRRAKWRGLWCAWCSQKVLLAWERSANNATRSRHRDHRQPLIYILSTGEHKRAPFLSFVYSSLFWNVGTRGRSSEFALSAAGAPVLQERMFDVVRNSIGRERFRPTGHVYTLRGPMSFGPFESHQRRSFAALELARARFHIRHLRCLLCAQKNFHPKSGDQCWLNLRSSSTVPLISAFFGQIFSYCISRGVTISWQTSSPMYRRQPRLFVYRKAINPRICMNKFELRCTWLKNGSDRGRDRERLTSRLILFENGAAEMLLIVERLTGGERYKKAISSRAHRIVSLTS